MPAAPNEDFHRLRTFERCDLAPGPALHRVLQHAAGHRSHICWLRDTHPGR